MITRILVLATTGLLSWNALVAQQARFDYVDLNMESVSPDQAAFRRAAVLKEDGYYHVHIRFLDGQTRMIGRYADEQLSVQDGYFEYYFFGGQPESQGSYQAGEKVGVWKRWTWNGTALPDRHYAKAQDRSLENRAACFPGGFEALDAYIASELEYPAEAKARGIEGTVEIAFSIDETGRIHNIHALSANHPLLAEVGQRLVASMPVWEPALRRGQGISSHFILPITFDLSNPE